MHEFSINGFSGEQAATFNKVLLEYAFSDDEFKLHELFSASAFASPQDARLNLDWGGSDAWAFGGGSASA